VLADPLSDKERVLLQETDHGATNRELAAKLQMREGTI
jgi:DNA-binding NarL/FixJ family response regulator